MDTSNTPTHHYICSECGYFSQNQGSCQTDDCNMQGQALKECHCDDGKHLGVKSEWSDDGTDSSSTQSVNTLDLDD
ncbi:MAG: hypothetical protein M3Q63_01705 [bacterium]|nr:hypothetical protein [bacterium]